MMAHCLSYYYMIILTLHTAKKYREANIINRDAINKL